ncbi:hypothetical protein RchiOBHm_Chr2g0165541 [Rosa chinensis]|uniref:Uncharacterized protein n=1 Tax=Rosa chinensis TaxID=74649 RepID=A0A2P6S3U4_ROSCH|nr:hypothetical protein RchiOBHm_Chr2g0165541 [Rosa chinensis]
MVTWVISRNSKSLALFCITSEMCRLYSLYSFSLPKAEVNVFFARFRIGIEISGDLLHLLQVMLI